MATISAPFCCNKGQLVRSWQDDALNRDPGTFERFRCVARGNDRTIRKPGRINHHKGGLIDSQRSLGVSGTDNAAGLDPGPGRKDVHDGRIQIEGDARGAVLQER